MHIRRTLGHKFFTKRIDEEIAKHLNMLKNFHTSEPQIFKEKDGSNYHSHISKVNDLPLFIERIKELRKVKDAKVVLGCDGGQGKLIVT